MTQQEKNIKRFIKNIVDGDYKQAHSDLQTVVENKLKRKIKKASKQPLY